MNVLLFILILLTTGPEAVMARKKRTKATLHFDDCGHSSHKAIHFHEIRANPMPIITPGTLYVTMVGNLTHELPRGLVIELSIMKYFFGLPVMLPCYNNRGSCVYENICDILEKYEENGCPRTLKSHEIQCHCPFKPGSFSLHDLAVNIPKIGVSVGVLLNGEGCPAIRKGFRKATGDYDLKVLFKDEERNELGCLHVTFSMKKRHRGWLFKI